MTRATASSFSCAVLQPSSARDGGVDAFEAENAEMSPASGEIRVSDFANGGNGHSFDYRRLGGGTAERGRLGEVLESKIILITLLIKLGVAAAVAAALARARTFQRLLLRDVRTAGQTLGLLAFICIPLGLGVYFRVTVPNFFGADISFETTILLGILVGTGPALIGASVLALPAVMHREYLALPFLIAVAITAGIYGSFVDKEDVWSFSPLVDLSLYRWVRRNLRRPRIDRQILLLMLIVAMEMLREWTHRMYPHRLFALDVEQLGDSAGDLGMRSGGGGHSAEDLERGAH